MKEEEKSELEEIIKLEIRKTREEIEELKELTKPIEPDNAIGRLSRMDAINNRTINESSLRENKHKLAKLERALEKVTSDNFGRCSGCGDEIAVGRLKFIPWSTKCVSCA